MTLRSRYTEESFRLFLQLNDEQTFLQNILFPWSGIMFEISTNIPFIVNKVILF